jgi:hypothetical protein
VDRRTGRRKVVEAEWFSGLAQAVSNGFITS